MSVRVVGLDPSAQYQNVGLGGYIEAYGAWEIAQACKQRLEALWPDRCRVVLSRDTVDSLKGHSDYLTREIKALNDAHCNIAIAIHSDAGGGRGVTCFKGGVESERIGQALLNAIDAADLLPLRQKRPIYHYKRRTYLGVIRNTNMPTVLIEAGFHDNKEDIKVLGTAAGRKAIGKALATGIANYYGWIPANTSRGTLKIVLLPGSEVISCRPEIKEGICRCDLRLLAEALGYKLCEPVEEHLKDDNKIYIKKPEAITPSQ